MKKFHLPLLVVLLGLINFPAAFSQEGIPYSQEGIQYSGEINLRGAYSNEDRLPFWMYHNQRGRLSEDTNFAGWVSGKGTYTLASGDTLQVGGGLLYQDGASDKVFLDELYAMYQSHWLRVHVGRKQEEQLYNGLSTSNRSILRSLNARPLPGFEIRSRKPLVGDKGYGLGFEFSWGEFFLGKDRLVENTRVHHKSFHLVYLSEYDFRLKVGLQHYAQWAGETDKGKRPGGFEGFLDAATGKGGGNHLMGWEFIMSKKYNKYYVEFFYQHLLEDRSGYKMRNAPDGRYGIFIKTNDRNKFFNSLMYEFYTTHDQSMEVDGRPDNYFNHPTYASGWTYENRVIGSPLFTVNPEGEGIINNKFTAHHIGVGGQPHTYFETYPYRFLFTFARNEGTFAKGYEEVQNVYSLFYEQRVYEGFLDFSFQAGMEFTPEEDYYGLGIQVKKSF